MPEEKSCLSLEARKGRANLSHSPRRRCNSFPLLSVSGQHGFVCSARSEKRLVVAVFKFAGCSVVGSQWRESALFLSIKSEVSLRATRVAASVGVFLASVAALSTDFCVTRQIIFALSLSSELQWRVRVVGSVDRSYDCFAARCGLIVTVAWRNLQVGQGICCDVLSRQHSAAHS